MRRYEAMFLFDNAFARDWHNVTQEVQRLMDRAGAQLEVCVKFDERKLAYEIQKRKRGTYVLVYFKSPTDKITAMERDIVLSEPILRGMILSGVGVSDERIAELKAHPAEQPLSPLGPEMRRDDAFDGGPPRRGDRFDRGDRGGRGGPREEIEVVPVGALDDDIDA